jgi:hypothetical protein
VSWSAAFAAVGSPAGKVAATAVVVEGPLDAEVVVVAEEFADFDDEPPHAVNAPTRPATTRTCRDRRIARDIRRL